MNFVAVSYILPFVVKVNHPNVIRLLAACTDPGGPLYLIMEFALHGSLRWALEAFHSQAIPLRLLETRRTDPLIPSILLMPPKSKIFLMLKLIHVSKICWEFCFWCFACIIVRSLTWREVEYNLWKPKQVFPVRLFSGSQPGKPQSFVAASELLNFFTRHWIKARTN